MKRLFVIGFGQCVASVIPVMVWTLMGKLHGDSFANGMTYTYPYQFIFLLLWHVTFIGNIKHEMKEKLGDRNHSRTGILMGALVGMAVTVISIAGMSGIGPFLGVSDDMDAWAFLFGLCSMMIDWPAYYMGEQYQYYGEEKRGTRFITMWYVSKLILVCMTALPAFDHKSATVFVLSVQAVMLMVLAFKHARPKKLQFSMRGGVRYSIHDIFYGVFMALIYLFGVHGMAQDNLALLAAFNLMVLCTDTQWDACGAAIDVVVTGYVCDGTFEKDSRRIFRENVAFSALMTASCYVMLGCMLLLYRDVDLWMALIVTTIELSTMIPYGMIDTMSAYVGVARPSAWIGVLTVMKYMVRLLAQVLIPSPYAISIALPVAVLFDLPFRIWLYKSARKKMA